MPSLKDLRNRIASVKSTQKITKAMQMVAAAKLRRAQVAAEAVRPYATRMGAMLSQLADGAATGGASSPRLLIGTGQDKVHLLIVCTSERGLCGAFNSSIVRLVREHIHKLQSDGKTVKIFTVGKKGNEQLRRQYESLIVEQTEFRGIKQLGYENATSVSERVLEMFEQGEFDVATLFYAQFKSVIHNIPTGQKLIPADISVPDAETAKPKLAYEYEPGEAGILEALLPKNVSIQIFRALLENAAAEQGSRMSAMDNATRNAGEMIKRQTQIYNRSRQAIITKELIEIISGAEAL